MTAFELPADGPLPLGPVQLPAGERITPYGSQVPVAWMTTAAVPDAGLILSVLTDIGDETGGLVPILIPPGIYHHEHGADFGPPDESDDADRFTDAEVMAKLWGENTPSEAEYARYPEYRESLEPFGRQFPGLAPAEHGRLAEGAREHALRMLPEAHVGLVRARRPADVLVAVGWSIFDAGYNPLPVSVGSWCATVLRSWEDRFGARLMWVESDRLRLLVGRPPQTVEAATRVAAEHWAFADECGGVTKTSIKDLAAALVGAPVWTYWWD